MSSKQASALATSYDSSFESDTEQLSRKRRHQEQLLTKESSKKASHKATRADIFDTEVAQEEGRRRRSALLSLNAYDRHKQLINAYALTVPGSTSIVRQRDDSRDRTDLDELKSNHKFIWDEEDDKDDSNRTWGEQLARRYYAKLYREYCICDLSRYKEDKLALRWRTHKELVEAKGHFTCGEKRCGEKDHLRTWEVHFGYVEQDVKKEALVKLRLCPTCSIKLNFKRRRREVTKSVRKERRKKEKKAKKEKKKSRKEERARSEKDDDDGKQAQAEDAKASEIWSQPLPQEGDDEAKTREDDFDSYLEDLFL